VRYNPADKDCVWYMYDIEIEPLKMLKEAQLVKEEPLDEAQEKPREVIVRFQKAIHERGSTKETREVLKNLSEEMREKENKFFVVRRIRERFPQC
jgi:hypothetical protein